MKVDPQNSISQKLKGRGNALLNRFLPSETYKKYFFNTGWLVAEKIIRLIANLVVGSVVLRYLGPDNNGILSFATSYIAFVVPVAGLGLGDILVRELIRQPENEGKVFGTALYMRVFTATVAVLGVWGWVYFTHEPVQTKIIIYIVSLTIVFQSFDVFDRFFQSKVKARTSVKSYIFSLLLSSCIKIILVLMSAPLYCFAIVQVFEIFMLAGGWIYWYIKTIPLKPVLQFSAALVIRFLKESWALIISGLMVVAYMRLDTQMIHSMLGDKALGNFSAGVKFSESYYFIAIVLINSLLPAIISGKAISELEYRSRLQKLYDLLTWISLPIAITIALVADPLAVLLVGHKYSHVGAVLSLHIWAGVFVFWGQTTDKCLTIDKVPYFVTIKSIVGLVVNASLNLYLIPRQGYLGGVVGAAFATVAGQFSANVLCLLVFNRTRYILGIITRSFNVFRVIRGLRKGISAN